MYVCGYVRVCVYVYMYVYVHYHGMQRDMNLPLENYLRHSLLKMKIFWPPPNFSNSLDLQFQQFFGSVIFYVPMKVSPDPKENIMPQGKLKSKGNKAILYPTKLDHS